jgi:tRNA(Ile2)-agmatinylcytidine synthase
LPAKEIVLHLGLDDTDSPEGGCTTYLAELLCQQVNDSLTFIDYPNLVRLNPNVPFKTRGNGAIAIRVRGTIKNIKRFEKAVKIFLKAYLQPDSHAQPCLAFVEESINPRLYGLYKNALNTIIDPNEAIQIAQESNAKLESFPGFSGARGVVGALAAIGWGLSTNDYTFELIGYRIPENWKAGSRLINPKSVFEMNRRFPNTFGNIDPLNEVIKIAPHGPDPVLCGIRGNSPDELLNAWQSLSVLEPVSGIMLFRSNQGTGAHFQKESQAVALHPHDSVLLGGAVVNAPKREIGGHLFFNLQNEEFEIQCAAYEPTKQFRDQLEQLAPGDEILVAGGVRPATQDHPLTLNLEKVRVLKFSARSEIRNPLCPSCGKRLKSAGKGKGYKCRRCSLRFPDFSPLVFPISLPKTLRENEWIQPPVCAWRHLTKPPSRLPQTTIWNPDICKIDRWIKKERHSFLNNHSN